jgi:hypothetical protein
MAIGMVGVSHTGKSMPALTVTEGLTVTVITVGIGLLKPFADGVMD